MTFTLYISEDVEEGIGLILDMLKEECKLPIDEFIGYDEGNTRLCSKCNHRSDIPVESTFILHEASNDQDLSQLLLNHFNDVKPDSFRCGQDGCDNKNSEENKDHSIVKQTRMLNPRKYLFVYLIRYDNFLQKTYHKVKIPN